MEKKKKKKRKLGQMSSWSHKNNSMVRLCHSGYETQNSQGLNLLALCKQIWGVTSRCGIQDILWARSKLWNSLFHVLTGHLLAATQGPPLCSLQILLEGGALLHFLGLFQPCVFAQIFTQHWSHPPTLKIEEEKKTYKNISRFPPPSELRKSGHMPQT